MTKETPTLFILSGLPAAGKSALAKLLAKEYRAAWLRVDTVEQGLRDLLGVEVRGEGYRLTYRVAVDNLRAGLHVVADSCNPWELTRREWEAVAADNGARFVNIEVTCSDAAEHRRRVETRLGDIAGLKLPDWEAVRDREYHPWSAPRIVIDTAGKSASESFAELKHKLNGND